MSISRTIFFNLPHRLRAYENKRYQFYTIFFYEYIKNITFKSLTTPPKALWNIIFNTILWVYQQISQEHNPDKSYMTQKKHARMWADVEARREMGSVIVIIVVDHIIISVWFYLIVNKSKSLCGDFYSSSVLFSFVLLPFVFDAISCVNKCFRNMYK